MKIRPMVAGFRADGQTCTTKLTVTFHSFTNACNVIFRHQNVNRLYHPELCYKDMILLIIKRHEMYVQCNHFSTFISTCNFNRNCKTLRKVYCIEARVSFPLLPFSE